MAGRRQPPSRVLALACWGLLAVSGWGGCRSDEPAFPVVLFSVEDRASRGYSDFSLPEQRLLEIVEREVGHSGAFTLAAEPAEGVFRLEITVAAASERGPSVVDDPSQVYRALQVDAVIWRRQRQVRQEFSASERAYQGQSEDEFDRQQGFEQVLVQALRSCLQWLHLQLQASSWSSEQLAAQLQDADARRRFYLLRVLRERRLPELVPVLIGMLDDEDTEVVLETVGALVAQGDRRAVLPLIRASRGKDLLFLSQIVTAVGQLGGVQAQGFLFTLAAGHPAEQIKRLAAETLQRLHSRQGAGPVPPRAEQALVLPAGAARRTGGNGGEP